MNAIINGIGLRTEEDFHLEFSRVFSLAPYYGHNLDALWDRLSTDIERPVVIVWMNSAESKKQMGEVFDRIVGVFDRVKEHDASCKFEDRFDYVLA